MHRIFQQRLVTALILITGLLVLVYGFVLPMTSTSPARAHVDDPSLLPEQGGITSSGSFSSNARDIPFIDNGVLSANETVIYNFQAQAGQTIIITLQSSAFDPYLFLSSSGFVLAEDDDSGGNLNSRIEFEITTTDTYTVEVASFSGSGSGPYTLSVAVRGSSPDDVGRPNRGNVLDDPFSYFQRYQPAFQPLVGQTPISVADLVPDGQGNLGLEFAVDNNLSQTLIVSVFGGNPNTVVDYINSAQLYFRSDPFNSISTVGFDFQNGLNNTSDQRTRPDLFIDFELLTSNLPPSPLYTTYVVVDPEIEQGQHHRYGQRQSISMAAGIRSGSGANELLMSLLGDNMYMESLITHRAGNTVEEIISDRRESQVPVNYDATVTGVEFLNSYEFTSGFVGAEICSANDLACIQNERPETIIPIACPIDIEENFAGNSASTRWFVTSSENVSAGFARDAYNLTITTSGGSEQFPSNWGSLQDQRFGDAEITAVIRQPELSVDLPASTGIWTRFQDGNNFLGFMISNRGEYRVARFQNSYTELTGGAPWLKHNAILEGQGVSNELRIVSQGEQFDFYINGIYVTTVYDATWPDGRIAFYGSADRNSLPANFYLDSISICAR